VDAVVPALTSDAADVDVTAPLLWSPVAGELEAAAAEVPSAGAAPTVGEDGYLNLAGLHPGMHSQRDVSGYSPWLAFHQRRRRRQQQQQQQQR
jgi:hypothetical protein